MKRLLPQWENDVRGFRFGQDMLQKQRFHFPDDWMDVERVDAELSSFTELLNRYHNYLYIIFTANKEKCTCKRSNSAATNESHVKRQAYRR